MKTAYFTERSEYFFAFGYLLRIEGDKAKIRLEPEVLYTTAAEIRTAVNKFHIDLSGKNNSPENLQRFFEQLKRGEIPRELVRGRFIALGKGEDLGRVLCTGEIIRFGMRHQSDISIRCKEIDFKD